MCVINSFSKRPSKKDFRSWEEKKQGGRAREKTGSRVSVVTKSKAV